MNIPETIRFNAAVARETILPAFVPTYVPIAPCSGTWNGSGSNTAPL
ncbi:MAG: hypothetical protein ACLSVG_08695 [Clostridia bacterium]